MTTKEERIRDMSEEFCMLTVHTEQRDYTLYQLKEDVDAADIITNPDYQRNYVYDDKKASSLVESILIGIPIPVIYLCEEDDGCLTVIDGQQRIVSFVRFLKNEFPLVGLTKVPSINGLYYRDLDKNIQRTLRQKSLKAIIINKDSQDLKYDIFSRLNLGAVKLKDQEVRNCIYRGSFNNMLKEIAANNKTLKVLFHDENKRSAYEERVLRFFALRDYLNLRGTFKKTMNSYMEKHQEDDDISIKYCRDQYNSLIDTIKCVMGEDAFFSLDGDKRKKFNGAVYDSIIIPFSYFNKRSLFAHADEIRTAINNIKLTNKEYQNNTYVGTNAGPRVRGRIQIIMNLLDRITKDDVELDKKRTFDFDIKAQLYYEGCKCAYCGNAILSIEDCEVDHIIPYDKGGKTSVENAQLLHRHCNRSKQDKDTMIEQEMVDDSDDSD